MRAQAGPLLAVVVGCLLALTACTAAAAPADRAAPSPSATPAATSDGGFRTAMTRLEQRYGARLGVAVLDTGTGASLVHRAHERFASASTTKAFIAAATLADASDADLEQVVRYTADDLLDHAPVTAHHVDSGMTVRGLVDAALRFSDNTAANLLVERLGGPAAVQRFLRSIGDTTTSVDRVEPQLNSALPGDPRDTATPAAFAADLRAVLLGDVLPAERRAELARGMRRSTTGDADVRAGVPAEWTVEDRTGRGGHGTRNDIAVVRPPGRAPVVVVLLSDREDPGANSDDALLADATRAIVQRLGGAAG